MSLSLVLEKLCNVVLKLRDRGLTDLANEIEEVINMFIPEVELDEIDLEAIKELEKAERKNDFVTLEEHLRST